LLELLKRIKNKVKLTAIAIVILGLVEKERSKLVAYIVKISKDLKILEVEE
jgi:hypothetical protein